MIKVQKEDTIIDILKKIDSKKSKNIVLDFPFGHPILHNHLSLKIIKARTIKKNLSIRSNDKTAKKISKILGIKFIKNTKKIIKVETTTEKILKTNFNFFEYTIFEIKNNIFKIKNKLKGNIKENKKINNIYYLKNKYLNNNNNKVLFYFLFILIGILILLFYVYYIAINVTEITIYPENVIKTKSKNFNFVEKVDNNKKTYNNQIYVNKINLYITLNKTFGTSGIRKDRKNQARGKITLYNYKKEKILLLKNTTFENKEGLQFYIDKNISIPSGKIINQKFEPGKITTVLYGKAKLINGKYSGKTNNIKKNILLTIPKLGKDKTNIFAKSITNFKGGTDNFTNILTKKDLENSKKEFVNLLKEDALIKLKEYIKKQNKNNTIKINLLPVDNIIKFSNLKINIPEHIKIGDNIKTFSINGSIDISSFTYNKEYIISELKNSINEIIIPDSQKILSINDSEIRFLHTIKRNDLKKINLKYEYTNFNKKPFILKSTIQIEYTISNLVKDKSLFFLEKIKRYIAGKNIEEAKKILINMPEINDVKINVKPFFIKNISPLIKNIKINIEN